MTIPEQVQTTIDGLKPMLMAQGRDIAVLEAGDERIRVSLSGFCGDCGCSKDYVDGLKEMLSEQFPSVQDIQLEIA